MPLEKRWKLANPSPHAETLARVLGVSPITALILANRGITDPDVARKFLKPELADLHDPSLLAGLDNAAERICKAAAAKERIVIYGDYDADGITATAILVRCLRLIGGDVHYYVPDRLEEGYGLNVAAVRKLAADGARLIVTVDCGISAVEEVALAKSLGMEIIITDHHEPGDAIPENVLVINPKLPGSAYPFRELSGAGLAFKLAWAVARDCSQSRRVTPQFREFLVDVVSLAALGTIADVVPLRDENRILAHFGLRGLSSSSAVGIKALCEAADLEPKKMSAFDVGFKLAPRLNAAGRMGSARAAIDLLTTDSREQAVELAAGLNRENGRRQKMQERILDEARAMIEESGGVAGKRSIVLAREGWHSGVIGIVAARLVEEHCRPVVLLTLDEGIGHGSARSIAPLHLYDTLHSCSHRLIAFGGHAKAAGLRLKREELAAFVAEFEQAVAARITESDLVPILNVESEIELADINRPFVDEVSRLEPFGEGNPEPVMMAQNVAMPSGARRMGVAGRHLSFYVKQGDAAFRAVAFGWGDKADEIQSAKTCSLAFVPRLNRWNGDESIELDVKDIKLGSI